MNKVFNVLLVGAAIMLPAFASAQVPAYNAELIGPGHSSTMNNNGVVVGNDNGNLPGTAWVNDGSGVKTLPLPEGATGVNVHDINDGGVIVGGADLNADYAIDVPVKWTPQEGGGGYLVETLPLLPGIFSGDAVSINSAGVIVVAAKNYDTTVGPIGNIGYVIDGETLTSIGYAQPTKINDKGIILSSNGLHKYNAETADVSPVSIPPVPDTIPDGISASMVDINNENQVVVNILTSTIGHAYYRAIALFTIGGEWELIMNVQTQYSAGSINDNGDITFGNYYYGRCGLVYLSGLGFYCPESLLSENSLDWEAKIPSTISNDRAYILTRGSNSSTGEYGIVRLVAAGLLPTPSAPLHLVAAPHEPTWQQPFVSIDLTWEAGDSFTKSYIVERKGAGDTDFVRLTTLTNTYYRDMDVVGGEEYDYRIIAVGVAGNSVPSSVVSAPAPMQPDSENPIITSISLQNGEVVSGTVSISVSATDNVGIRYIDMSASNLSCTVYSADATCNWKTAGLTAGEYTVTITAVDEIGNYARETVTVTVEEQVSDGGDGSGKDKPKKGNGGSGNGKGKGNK